MKVEIETDLLEHSRTALEFRINHNQAYLQQPKLPQACRDALLKDVEKDRAVSNEIQEILVANTIRLDGGPAAGMRVARTDLKEGDKFPVIVDRAMFRHPLYRMEGDQAVFTEEFESVNGGNLK